MAKLKRIAKQRRREALRRLQLGGAPEAWPPAGAHGNPLAPLNDGLFAALKNAATPAGRSVIKNAEGIFGKWSEALIACDEALAAARAEDLINDAQEEALRTHAQDLSRMREEDGRLTFPLLTVEAVRAAARGDRFDPERIVAESPRILLSDDPRAIEEFLTFNNYRAEAEEREQAIEARPRWTRLGMFGAGGTLTEKGCAFTARMSARNVLVDYERAFADSGWGGFDPAASELDPYGDMLVACLHEHTLVWPAEMWEAVAHQALVGLDEYTVPEGLAEKLPARLWTVSPAFDITVVPQAAEDLRLPAAANLIAVALAGEEDGTIRAAEIYMTGRKATDGFAFRPHPPVRPGQILPYPEGHSLIPILALAEFLVKEAQLTDGGPVDEVVNDLPEDMPPRHYYRITPAPINGGADQWHRRFVVSGSWPA